MRKKESLKVLLDKAAISIRRKAIRNKVPLAISENGEIILVYPDNKKKVVYSAKRKKQS